MFRHPPFLQKFPVTKDKATNILSPALSLHPISEVCSQIFEYPHVFHRVSYIEKRIVTGGAKQPWNHGEGWRHHWGGRTRRKPSKGREEMGVVKTRLIRMFWIFGLFHFLVQFLERTPAFFYAFLVWKPIDFFLWSWSHFVNTKCWLSSTVTNV